MIVNVNDYIISNLNKSLYEINDEGYIIINDQKSANIIFNHIMQYDSFNTDMIFDHKTHQLRKTKVTFSKGTSASKSTKRTAKKRQNKTKKSRRRK